MRYILFLSVLFSMALNTSAQSVKTAPLPPPVYVIMRDSTTSIDIVYLQGAGGSMSVDGKNVHIFNSFFENETAQKSSAAATGMIMWQINGREYLSGNFYLGDSTGYVVVNRNGKEYVNRINNQGNSFFKSHIK